MKIIKICKKELKNIWKTITMSEMQVLPGQLAFFFVLSVIPIIALLGYLGIYFSFSSDQLADLVNKSFPNGVVNDLFAPIIRRETLNSNMILFLITSFVLASNGAYSIIIVSNSLYKVNAASFLKGRIKSIFMTFIIVFLIIFILLVPTLGSIIIDWIGGFKHLTNISSDIKIIFSIIKWPLSLIFIYFNIKLIYTIAPSINLKSREVTKGAIFTTVMWIFLANVYSTYLSNFTNYDIFYGSISNIIILLLWIYLLSYIFVMGLALNTLSREVNKKIEEN